MKILIRLSAGVQLPGVEIELVNLARERKVPNPGKAPGGRRKRIPGLGQEARGRGRSGSSGAISAQMLAAFLFHLRDTGAKLLDAFSAGLHVLVKPFDDALLRTLRLPLTLAARHVVLGLKLEFLRSDL